jgi:hypothetical protein
MRSLWPAKIARRTSAMIVSDTTFGVDRNAGCGQRVDGAQHRADGYVQFLRQRNGRQPTVAA